VKSNTKMTFRQSINRLLAVATLSLAASGASAENLVPLSYQCLQQVSQKYGIHMDVFFAILMVEGGTVGQNNKGNTNGTYDIGPFQINSMHLPWLNDMGITETQLRNNGCVNANVAAMLIQRSVMNERVLSTITDGRTYLAALARYHSATPVHNERYAGLLANAFNRLQAASGGVQ